MAICPNCQTENPEGANFCRGCGGDLRTQLPQPAVSSPPPPPQPSTLPPSPQPIAQAEGIGDNIINYLSKFSEKLPIIPEKYKESFVKFIPWIALLQGIVILLIQLVFANPLLLPLQLLGLSLMGLRRAIIWLIVMGLGFWTAVYDLKAYRRLKTRSYSGWRYLMFASLLTLLWSTVSLFSGELDSNSIEFLFGSIIEIWLLLQVKNYYS